jgi:hypothetical protein
MPAVVTIYQLYDFIYRRSPVRDLIQPLVDQPFQTFVFIPANIAPECTLTNTQQPRRFFLRQTPALPTSIRFFEPHLPSLRNHFARFISIPPRHSMKTGHFICSQQSIVFSCVSYSVELDSNRTKQWVNFNST